MNAAIETSHATVVNKCILDLMRSSHFVKPYEGLAVY